MTENITFLSEITGDGRLSSPSDTLRQAQKEIASGDLTGDKLIVIALDDSNGKYDVRWLQAGMTMSQMLALLEIVKGTVVAEMGY